MNNVVIHVFFFFFKKQKAKTCYCCHLDIYLKNELNSSWFLFLIAGVNNIFTKVECDRSAIEDMLGSSSGITENNIMSYLSLVEQKTNELLTVQAFLSTKVIRLAF